MYYECLNARVLMRALTTVGALFIVLAFASNLCFPQTFMSSLTGNVTDPTGSAVTGATVELKNVNTNDIRRTTSAADGTFDFANVLPGAYEIAITSSGFKKYERTGLIVQAGTSASITASLEVGATQESIQVTGEAVLLDTESANRSVTLNTQMVSQLPTNTRSPLNFVFALAGTTEAQGGMTSSSTNQDQMFSMFGLQGGRSGNAQILLDGAASTAIDWGGLMVSPTIESVQEMQIIQNTYDAQYSKSGAGVVTVVSKGGTTAFHGGAFDFLRNDNLDANWWSNNTAGLPKGEFKRNQFGGYLGGPILKRYNLFFFASYEGLREPSTSASGFWTVPTAAERQGDFSQSRDANGNPVVIYNPFSTHKVGDVYTRDPFPGNQIPQNLLNPVGVKMANLYPLPNRTGEGPSLINNYYSQGHSNVTNDHLDYRVDWAQNEKHRLFVRASHRLREDGNPACFICNGADPIASTINPGFQVTLNDTITPSPTWVISLLIGASRWQEGQTAASYGKIAPGDLGLNPADYQVQTMPDIGADNFTGLGFQQGRVYRGTRYSHTLQGNVTKQMSSHSLRFGANFDILMINNFDEKSAAFSFSRAQTACDPASSGPCVAPPSSSEQTGSGMASMLLGVGGGYAPYAIDKAMSQHNFGVYVQDTWRVTPRLTLDLGVRYENQRPATERYDRIASFDPNVLSPVSAAANLGRPIYGGVVYNAPGQRSAWPADNNNIAPRVGMAYKVSEKLVGRAGFGIFYLPSSAMLSYDNAMFLGYGTTTNWIATENGLGYVPTNTLSNPFPSGPNKITGSSAGLMTQVGQNLDQIWPTDPHPTGYTEHFSAGVQYEVSRNSVLEVGYTGWRGRKLMYGNPIEGNQLPTQYLSLGAAVLDKEVPNPFYGIITDPNSPLSGTTVHYNQLLRPYPQYTSIAYTRSIPGARASFNALNVKFNHTFGSSLNVMSTYQYSKTMDNGSEDFIGWIMGSSWRDNRNTMLDYSISAHDMPHSFVTAAVWQVPFGTGKKWGGSLPGAVRQAFGNWELSTVVRLNSGLPVFPILWSRYSNPLNAYGFPSDQRVDLVGNPKPANQTPDHWINPDAFAEPAPGTLGNAPRYIDSLRESAAKNIDLGLMKNFKAEAFRIQFRADFLNLFNTPQFGGGDQWGTKIENCVTCGGVLGTVYGQRNNPRNIQLSLKADFDDD